MRLSDLIGAEVVEADGTSHGDVEDVRLVQDGPVVEGWGSLLRVAGVVTGRGAVGIRLGFGRGGVEGPRPLAALFGRLERRADYWHWDDVESWEDGRVRLRPGATPVHPE
jgi:hypothetical protein